MNSKLVKTFVAATLAGVVFASPAMADGWGHGGYYRGWGYGGYRGAGWGVAAAAGLLGGLAIGAIASQPRYPAAYGGYAPGCYLADEPVTDPYGNLVAYRKIRVCE